MSSFANFYVGTNEITKQFKGCYRHNRPLASTVGTLSGSGIQSGIQNIVPVPYTSNPNIWIFAGVDGSFVKMVGMKYGKNSKPTRVDGRAFSLEKEQVPSSSPELNATTLSNFWDNASQKNLGEDVYSLTLSDNSPLKSINTCLQNASNNGDKMFGVTHTKMGEAGEAGEAGVCITVKEASDNNLIPNMNEAQCLLRKDATTVYDIQESPSANAVLGKTFMGKTSKDSDKMVFHPYPDSLLSLGKTYQKLIGYDSPDNTINGEEITESTVEECQQYCLNLGNECKGFVYDKANSLCELKNKIYPNTNRVIKKSYDMYTRMPVVKNSPDCPQGVKAVSTDFITKNGFLSNEYMSTGFQCETEKGVKDDVEGLEKAYTTLTEELGNLRKDNETILSDFKKVRKNIMESTKSYHKVDRTIKQKSENQTLEQLLHDSKQLSSLFSLRNSGYILALVLFSIFLVRSLRK